MVANSKCAFITEERISLGKKIVDDLDERIRTGKPLNDTQQRVVAISLDLWDIKHPFGFAGLYAYAAMVSCPDDVVDLTTPQPKKPLRGKQTISYRTNYREYVMFLWEGYTLLPDYEKLSRHKRCILLAQELSDLYLAQVRGKVLPDDGFRKPLVRAVRHGGGRITDSKGIIKAFKKFGLWND